MSGSLILCLLLELLSCCWVSLSSFDVMVFVLFYFVMFGSYILEACSFLMKGRKGVNLEGRGVWEGLDRIEGGETIIKIYYMRKEIVFNV